ncbi:MAG TPA: phosphate-starvation-inducible PsiE family protein [Methanocorpusculum sp.]|nr:phosphate-starvation-inducible PsiE family protein [Methanocorpusculum sp.]
MEKTVRTVLTKTCSVTTLILYLIIALLLIASAVIGTVHSIQLIIAAFEQIDSHIPLTIALQSILLVIVIVSLIDMVRSYIKFGRILIRPILIAGITAMVRRLLIAESTFEEMVGIAILILVLAVAMVFLSREDRKIAKCAKLDAETLEENTVKQVDD